MSNTLNNYNLKNVTKNFLYKNRNLVILYIIYILALLIERIIFPHYYGLIIDNISSTDYKNIFDACSKYIIIVIILAIVSQAMFTFTDYLDSVLIPRAESFLRNTMIEKIINRFKTNYKDLELGDLISKIIKLPATIRDLYHQTKTYILSSLVVSVFTIIYFCMINIQLGILSAICITLYFISIYLIGKKCMNSSVIRDKSHNHLHEHIADVFNNLLTIYNFNKTHKEYKVLSIKSDKFNKKYTKSLLCGVKFKIAYSVLYILLFILINGYAFYLTYNGTIKVQNLITILFIITYLLGDLQSCAGEIRNFMYNIGVLRQSHHFLNNLIQLKINHGKKHNLNIKKGNIIFKNISFGYIKTNNILNNFNIHLYPEITVIKGDVGCGKSTITKLIMKLYQPQSGKILIDNTDINTLDPDTLRQNIAYIPQNTKLFNRTIYENITYGKNMDKEDVINLINRLKLKKVFNNIDNLLDKYVGKNGEKLSGGQRQIVCLLRILINIKNYSIIIADEPTSALDKNSKKHVIRILNIISKKKTTIIISHDNKLSKIANRIIYMKKGKIVKDTSQNNPMNSFN